MQNHIYNFLGVNLSTFYLNQDIKRKISRVGKILANKGEREDLNLNYERERENV